MFIETQFKVVIAWKKQRCPSIGEWINNLWYSHRMGY